MRRQSIPGDLDLSRFVNAQEPVYAQALAELRAGAKRSHWMWFVFPQFAGLGHSAMARMYAIESVEEARAYLRHPVLGPRLRACTEALLCHAGRDAAAILGAVDAVKFRSSMTLFDHAADPGNAEPFARCLDLFFGGAPDPATLRLLNPRRPAR